MRLSSSIAVLLLFASSVDAGDSACPSNTHAPFHRLLGEWEIRDWARDPDGGWKEQPGGTWRFQCLSRGIAIQDFYRSNDGRTVGTNLRIREPDSQRWQVVWTATDSPGLSRYVAEWDSEAQSIVMQSVDSGGPLQRAVYHDFTPGGWRWRLEVSSGDGINWQTVYRIEARRP